jgi:hypothetical protein
MREGQSARGIRELRNTAEEQKPPQRPHVRSRRDRAMSSSREMRMENYRANPQAPKCEQHFRSELNGGDEGAFGMPDSCDPETHLANDWDPSVQDCRLPRRDQSGGVRSSCPRLCRDASQMCKTPLYFSRTASPNRDRRSITCTWFDRFSDRFTFDYCFGPCT